jgi:hypothetical protein
VRGLNTITCPRCANLSRQIAENPQRTLYRCTSCRRLTEVPHVPGVKQLRFSCFNHQGKADRLAAALEAKYEQSPSHDAGVYFCLTDSDVSGRMMQLRRMQGRGCQRFFVYPHAARPSLINSHYPTWDGTTVQFVVNEHHAEVLRAYGYEKPLDYIGWHLSDVEQFKKRDTHGRAVKVLFAPIHPRNAQQDRDANKAAFGRLYKHIPTGEIELTVRYIGQLVESGLDEKPNVNYINGKMNQVTQDMDNADIVIGHQTFAWLAVARGFPCVMFAEDMPTHFRMNNQFKDVPCWNSVYHLFRYPLDILCEDDTMGLLRRTAMSDGEVKDWKSRMIGLPFRQDEFIDTVEKYL